MTDPVPSWMVHEILVACGLSEKSPRHRTPCPFCRDTTLFSFGPWHYSCLKCGRHGSGEDLADQLPTRYHDDAALAVSLPNKVSRHEAAALRQTHVEWLRWQQAMCVQVRSSVWRQLMKAREGERFADAGRLQDYLEVIDDVDAWGYKLRGNIPCTTAKDSCAK